MQTSPSSAGTSASGHQQTFGGYMLSAGRCERSTQSNVVAAASEPEARRQLRALRRRVQHSEHATSAASNSWPPPGLPETHFGEVPLQEMPVDVWFIEAGPLNVTLRESG